MANNTFPEPLKCAFQEVKALQQSRWGFAFSVIEDAQQIDVEYDPRCQPDCCYELKRVNGVEATERQRQRFLGQTETADERDDAEFIPTVKDVQVSALYDVLDKIQYDELECLQDSEEAIRYRFKPVLDIPLGHYLLRHLQGEITYCKTERVISLLRITNQKVFKPIPSIKVEQALFEVVFQRPVDNVLQLMQADLCIKGKKHFFSSMERNMSLRCYDHYLQE